VPKQSVPVIRQREHPRSVPRRAAYLPVLGQERCRRPQDVRRGAGALEHFEQLRVALLQQAVDDLGLGRLTLPNVLPLDPRDPDVARAKQRSRPTLRDRL